MIQALLEIATYIIFIAGIIFIGTIGFMYWILKPPKRINGFRVKM